MVNLDLRIDLGLPPSPKMEWRIWDIISSRLANPVNVQFRAKLRKS